MQKQTVRGFLLLLIGVIQMRAGADEQVRFDRDVLPILSARCFACHGPDAEKRQADLRLDQEQDIHREHTGGIPVVAGNPDSSVLLRRVGATDPDLLMPPPESGPSLTAAEQHTLRLWIEQGAEWGLHWSFRPQVRPDVASGGAAAIDELVGRQLAARSLQLSGPADPYRKVRRLYLDLIGLPPTPEQADAFAADPSPERWEQLVETLLQQPQFGEHWARMWMDLARYADTKGYEKDRGRTMWPWRDWLIGQLNADRPLNELTQELLAGDLLPNATTDQRLATAFHRNTMSNDEGGTDNEEFRTLAVKDRVDLTLQVWMGLTAGCAKCHSHKYDPLSQQEYYGLYAIFNQTADADRPDDAPLLDVQGADEQEQEEQLQKSVTALRRQLRQLQRQPDPAESERWQVPIPVHSEAGGDAVCRVDASGVISVSGPSPAENDYTIQLPLAAGVLSGIRIQALVPDEAGNPGVGRNPEDPNFVLSELELSIAGSDKSFQPLRIARATADFSQQGWPVTAAFDGDLKSGWAISPRQSEMHTAVFVLSDPVQIAGNSTLQLVMRQRYGRSLTMRQFRISVTAAAATEIEGDVISPAVQNVQSELADAELKLKQFRTGLPRVPVMEELPAEKRRETRLHHRGNFLDLGDSVQAGFPQAFAAIAVADMGSPGRLDLANWLMSDLNPLTSRVWVNRIWSRVMGQGIVATEEDFGALGALPSNPELLELLAVEYRENGWSLRGLLKSICLSNVYQQDSAVTAALLQADPENVLYARASRYRLSAEAVRDQLLAVSGLLSSRQGGPPVMPPQPPGLWRSTYNSENWVNAEGADRYRRSLYTYLKRTTPFPALTTFDSGSGEYCLIRRIRTNTPLQALVLLNDQTALEAAGALALRMMQQPTQQRLEWGMRQALIRPIAAAEAEPLQRLARELRAEYGADPESATALLSSARLEPAEATDIPELAAMIVIAGTILNQDEFLTRN